MEAYMAWMENKLAHVQIQLDNKYDQALVAVSREEASDQVRFEQSDRLSFDLEGVAEGALIQIRVYESKQLVHTALLRVGQSAREIDPGKERIKAEKSKWKKVPSDNLLSLQLIAYEEVEKKTSLEKREKAFYKRVFGSKDSDDAREVKEKKDDISLKNLLDTFELEPNDTKGKADWLYVGKDAYGKIRESGDVDYWKVKAPKTGNYRIWLGEIPSSQNYDLYLESGEGRELGKSTNSGSMDEVIEGISLEKGVWYYIKINGQQDDANRDSYYHLKAEYLAPGATVMPDKYESNNLPDNAAEAQSDTVYQATIHELGDVDYYKYRVDLASTLEFSLTNIPEGMDVDLYLLDSNQKQLAKSEKAKNADESIVFNGDPGYYYVKVVASKRSTIVHHEYKLEGVIRTMPVILIPGIGGSRLSVKENGRVSDAWLDLDGMLIDNMVSIHRRVLPLYPKKWGATEVVQKEKGVEIFPEEEDHGLRGIEYLSYSSIDYVKNQAEQYYSMSTHLQKMGYQKGVTLFGYPYDWRLSSSENAKLLKKRIDNAIRISKAKQVQIVAHSMGGILTKETLLSNPSYRAKTKRVIYMGTPFLGSPRAFQALTFGYDFGIILLNKETMRQVAEFSPAVYELLPSRTYVQSHEFLKKFDGQVDKKMPFSAIYSDPVFKLPYTPLVKQADKNHDKWDKKKLTVPQYSIIGQGYPTLRGYVYNEISFNHMATFDKATGDGTVPFDSANHDAKDIKKKFYVNEEHAALPKNPYVIQQVAHLLLGNEQVQPQLSEQPQRNFAYNYYVIYREDGKFPEVTLSSSSKTFKLDGSEQETEDVRVEYHGNVIVVQLPQNQKKGMKTYRLQASPSIQSEDGGIIIDHFSSNGNRSGKETNNRLRLQSDQSIEVKP